MSLSRGKRRLTIFHTNDFHNRLETRAAEMLSALYNEAEDPKVLLDAGDAGGSTNVTFRFAGEPILEEMFQLGYSAMTVGNRDFHISRAGFRAKLFRARFPVLCANVRPARVKSGSSSDERPLLNSIADDEPDIRSYVVKMCGDWRVLVVGLTVPMVTERMWERKLSSYIFDPPVKCAAKLIPGLRARVQPDLVIALSHIGLRLDRELAASVPEIDLIVGGHSHELLPEGECVNETMIVQAGSHGRHIGIVDVNDEGALRRPRMRARIEGL